MLAFCRTPGVRVLGAARARVLHMRALGSTRPVTGPSSPAEPRHTLAPSPQTSKPHWRPTAPPSELPWRHAGVGSGLCRGRRRPSHPRAPAAPGNSPCLSSCSSARARRRHDALQLQQRRLVVDLIPAAEPAPSRYKRRPRAPPSTQATPGHPHSFPLASNRRGGSFFLVSGQFGRRRNPVPFVATGASPANPTPPRASP